MSAPRILPMGDRALLVEYGSLEETLGAFPALDASAPRGVVDLVPAARTVLVRFDPSALSVRDARRWIEHTPPSARTARDGALVVIPVVYDGPDLADGAGALGISVETLIARHTGAEWTSAFIGFAPGFAYLTAPGWDADAPRRDTSRPRVPAGSVGLASRFTGVYPRESPGGWQLIGTTDARLWDAAADPPALLAPGTRVRFEVAS